MTNHLHNVIDRGCSVAKGERLGVDRERLGVDRERLGVDRERLGVDRAGLACDRGSIVSRECLRRVVHRLHPPVIKNHGLTVRSPLKGLEEELRYSVRFN